MKRFLFGFVAFSLVVLAACSGDPESTSPIVTPPPDDGGSSTGFSGTILAPAGGDVANTVVTACLIVNSTCDQTGSRQITVAQAGPSAAFNLDGLQAGQYAIIAYKDTNGNGSFGDAQDYQGFYTLDGQTPAQIEPPTGGLTVQMATVGGVAPQPPGGGSGDLTGTVLAPAGGDVAQTVVVACFLEAGQCDGNSPNTQSVTISTPGATGSFTVSGLATGQYIVGALKDTDNNGSFADPVDYFGCYGDGTDCAVVTPPQSGLDIQMTVEEGATDPGTGGAGSITGTIIFPGSRGASAVRSEVSVSERVLDQVAFPTQARPQDRQTPTGRFVPGDVIVKFRSDARRQSLSVQGTTLQRRQTLGATTSAGTGAGAAALYHAPGLDERGTAALIESLNARPDVLYAEPNVILQALKVPNDEFYPFQWHYEAMNLPAAWDITDGTGSDVTVAVIDSGSLPHPDLQNTLVGGYDFVSDPVNGADGDGYDPDPTDLTQDSVYHGTHVAGTVAAGTNDGFGVAGVSWGAKVLPVRVLGVTGGTLADIMNGVLWSAGESVAGVPENPNPAQVINMSLGGGAPCSQFAQEAFNTVRAKGVTVVVAAGNEDSDAGLSTPANCDGVIVVGATGPQGARAPYSNHGADIDVMAPGGDTTQSLTVAGETFPAGVLSTSKNDQTGSYNYIAIDGTSMAAPHIAGLVALMLAQEPGLDPDMVLARLQAGATPLSAEACNRPSGDDCGAGLVDAAAALSGTGTQPDDPIGSDPPPVTDTIATYAAALYCVAQCSDFDLDLSRGVEVPTDALEVPYGIGDLAAGTYIVAAWQDLNGNSEVNAGEPFGRHFNNLELSAGEEIDRADIYLQPFAPQATASKSVLYGALEARAALELKPSQEVVAELEGFRDPAFERALEQADRLLRLND